MKPGVFLTKKKDNSIYYRASITYKGKHISLGSFDSEEKASRAYDEASLIVRENKYQIHDYNKTFSLSFEKWICLINFRDNNMYCKTPIYLEDKYFIYYLSKSQHLIFDVDDLFYYSHHKIMKRGSHLFVADYGMQVNILSRYGIKNYSVPGKDYIFKNGINNDFRYSNIEVINRYHGVFRETMQGRYVYVARIHIIGDIIIGRYKTDFEAAIAYNKATDLLKSKGSTKNYPVNYIDNMDAIQYSSTYAKVRISPAIRDYPEFC